MIGAEGLKEEPKIRQKVKPLRCVIDVPRLSKFELSLVLKLYELFNKYMPSGEDNSLSEFPKNPQYPYSSKTPICSFGTVNRRFPKFMGS